jgi:predicted nucleic acid-binding protein
MIILDTNVISEAMRAERADPRVMAWIRGLRTPAVTTAINRAEILAGLALLPPGHRSTALQSKAAAILAGLGVCLPLTDECAPHYADIVATRTTAGRPIGGLDALIAAIARAAGASVATRDIGGFDGLGLDLIDPWVA